MSLGNTHIRSTILAILAVVLAALTEPASCQGMSAQLPDPIDSRTITRLLERNVKPTVAQWVLIEEAHEAYLARMSEFTEDEVARFLAFMRESLSGVPDSRTTREFLRRQQDLLEKIETDDERFLDEIAVHLQEEQIVGLQRVRNARERMRLTSGLGAPDSANRNFSMWRLLPAWEEQLSPEVVERVGPEIASYEERLLPLLRSWRKAQEGMMLALVLELQASDIEALSRETSSKEELEAALGTLKAAFQTALQASMEAANAIDRLNRKTIKSLESLAGDDLGRPLRMAYYELVTNPGINRDPGWMDRIFARLLESELVDAELRLNIQAMRRNYRESDDRLVAKLLPLVLELQDAYRMENPLGHPDEVLLMKRDAVRELMDEREAIAARARDELRQFVSTTGAPALVAIIDSGASEETEVAVEDRSHSEDVPEGDLGRGGPTDFLLLPISRRDLETIRDNLDPEPWQQAILTTIHDDYLQAWDDQVMPGVDACTRAQSAIYGVDASGTPTMDPQVLRRSYELARDTATKADAVDSSFFSNLAATMSDSQAIALRRLAIARALESYLRGTDLVFSPMEAAFRRPNIITLLEELDLTEEEFLVIDEFLEARAPGLLKSAREARDIRIDLELAMHELNLRLSRELSDGFIASTEYGIEFRKFTNRMKAEHGAAVESWKSAHSSFVEDLTGLLQERNAVELSRRWQHASNPMVYRDANWASEPLQQALQLHDLTVEQMEVIAGILAEHEVAWERISDEMVSVRDELRGFGALSPSDTYEDYHVLDQRFKKLEFDREEVNLRALRRLSRYLTPEQRERIRALRILED